MRNSCKVIEKLIRGLGEEISVDKREVLICELQRCMDSQNAILAQVAHQIQHPLALVRGYVELYFQNPTKHHKQIIDEELLNLMGQVQKLLRFAQTEFGNGKLELEMTEMIPFLRNIFDHFVKEKKSHKFKFNVPANRKIFAKIDCDEFSEVVQILLENAFKYVSKGKKIELGIEEQRASGQDDKQASKAGSNLLIFVRDEGSGIPKSNQEKIFASFFRGESYKSGTGLGLWIAKKIVQQHKGRMWVESEEGKGAEFFVRIKGGVEL